MPELWDERFAPADAEIIKHKARKLVGHYGYRTSDVEDIQQDLALHVFSRTYHHRPDLGSRETFVSTVVKNKILNLIEHRTALKRDHRRDVPADEVGEGVMLDGSSSPERIDLYIDLRSAIAGMPPELREIALRWANETEKEIADAMNLTRAKVRTRFQRIRRFLENAGFGSNSEI